MNRREVIPELKAYARNRGVPVYENVVTSQRGLGPNQVSFDQVLQDMHRQAAGGHIRLLTGGAEVGLGMLMLAQAGSAVYEDLRIVADPTTRSEAAWIGRRTWNGGTGWGGV